MLDIQRVMPWVVAVIVAPVVVQVMAAPPNLVVILADDLGYGDLGCYGQTVIQTPRLDRMAAEGMRFTQFYAGSTVCAPSRCVLMTGKHLGHCRVRGNGTGPEQALRPDDLTVARVLQQAGYATALVGKWGLGDMRPETLQGMPNRQGFDDFFGYANQVHAHNYFPAFLWRNEEKVFLQNVVVPADRAYGGFHGGAATHRVDYTHDLFAREAAAWIKAHRDEPFFLFLSLTIPHANNEGTRMFGDGAEVPDYGPYADKNWPNPDKGQAAMITRMDLDVGRILDLLKDLDIATNTLVLFSSDNGAHDEAGHDLDRFQPSGPLRGKKRDLYEGGIRVPTIAWWPGTVPAGSVTTHVGYFGDLMATACAMARIPIPDELDSISLLPTLQGDGDHQDEHAYLYWEFYEQGGRRALRQGDWKVVQPRWGEATELYHLVDDLGERRDLAAVHPERIADMVLLMENARTPSRDWPAPGE